MKKYKINEKEYELDVDYKDGFDYEAVLEKVTDYFNDFDYIVGDWSYGKLRLKGFYNHDNKNTKSFNDYSKCSDYIKNECAYDCRWFSLKKL